MTQIVSRSQHERNTYLKTFAGVVEVGGRGRQFESGGAGLGREDVEYKGPVNHFHAVEVAAAEVDFEFFFEGHGFVVQGKFH